MRTGLRDCADLIELPRGRASGKEWPVGIAQLLSEARMDVDQLERNGYVERALELSRETGMHFDASCNPMYFTGAFESPIVLVHLNPKLSEELADYTYSDFEDYFFKHRNFGSLHWESDPGYYSPFDLKQVRFLRAFGVIDFVPKSESGHLRINAAMAIDEKLQLELIPYASHKFETEKFSNDLLRLHISRVLAAIVSYTREYVIFCGAVFDDLLDHSGLLTFRKDHYFHLPTKSGQSKTKYRFSNVQFNYQGINVRAGIARSFAIQGIPMDAYGMACSQLYGTEESTNE
jgi:hypothetical protein